MVTAKQVRDITDIAADDATRAYNASQDPHADWYRGYVDGLRDLRNTTSKIKIAERFGVDYANENGDESDEFTTALDIYAVAYNMQFKALTKGV